MNIKKTIIAAVCTVLVLLPFVFVAYNAVFGIPAQYDETFLGELAVKHERLKTVEGPKIVLIGGSSLAFGVDSELLEEYTGMPVVNYGLYAAIGTKAMLDMSKNHIGEGDIVVICPETEAQTYSLYYNGESMLQAMDGHPEMLEDAGFSNYGKLFASLPSFTAGKLGFYESGTKPGASGIYSMDSFNGYGDISVERKYNEMVRDYDSAMPIVISVDIIGDGFIEYLNSYAVSAERKGAKVFFGFSPMNAAAVSSRDEDIEEFYVFLGENLKFPLISDIDDYILGSAYFYDTNFHLNTRGAALRTALLADDILREIGNTEFVETVKYSAPKRPENYFDKEDTEMTESEKAAVSYLVLEMKNGSYTVTGLTDEGKKQKSITIPKNSDGTPIIEIGTEAFDGSTMLAEIIIPADTNITTFASRAFAGASGLVRIENHAQPSELTASATAFEGMNGDCFVYVPSENYGTFAGDYFWGGMMRYVKEIQ